MNVIPPAMIKWPNLNSRKDIFMSLPTKRPFKLVYVVSNSSTHCIKQLLGTLNSSVTENNLKKKKVEEVAIISLFISPGPPFRWIPTMTARSSSYKPFLRPLQPLPWETLNQRPASLSSVSPTTHHAPLTPVTNKAPSSPSAPVYQPSIFLSN